MKKRKKIPVLISGSIIVAMLLVLALILVAPQFIKSDFVKKEIITYLSSKADGQVEFSRADFSFFSTSSR